MNDIIQLIRMLVQQIALVHHSVFSEFVSLIKHTNKLKTYHYCNLDGYQPLNHIVSDKL